MDYEKVLNEKIRQNVYQLKEAQAIYDYAINLQTKKLPVIFDRHHLSLYLNIPENFLKNITFQNNIDALYNSFSIPKRNGGFREINAPKEKLKLIQVWIYKNILSKISVSCAAKAYIKNNSIVDNAKYHVGKHFILKLDFKDFFLNISFEKIFSVFFNMGYTKGVSYILAKLCSYKEHLAQGAPTSPYISNLCCNKLDKRLLKYCQYHGMCYTRYADDITISSNTKFSRDNISIIKKIIEEEKYIINKDKTKILDNNKRHLITGIVANTKLNVLRTVKNKLRQEIYYCKKYGVNNHLQYNGKIYSFYKEHLYGMAYYILMINKTMGCKFINELNEIIWDY